MPESPARVGAGGLRFFSSGAVKIYIAVEIS